MSRFILAAAALLVVVGCGSDEEGMQSFRTRLTHGPWTRTISADPIFSESYTYEFDPSGTYLRTLCTDIFPPPEETGTWTLEVDAEGRTHLLLLPDPPLAECYWLACDSVISFDEMGRLIVSGPTYTGELPLSPEAGFCAHAGSRPTSPMS